MRGECGAVYSQARDGRWYCVKRKGCVTADDCQMCDERPKSMRSRDVL